MSKKTAMAAIMMIAAGLFSGAANAHPELQSAEPAAGAAMVEWHAVSDDTHRVTGRYSFSVAR